VATAERPAKFREPETRSASSSLADRYPEIRHFSEALCAGLEPEDLVAQSMPDASPVKWHLAHTTWFFETFVLQRFAERYQSFHPTYGYLFNSYYNAVGRRHARPLRGVLTRPTVREVLGYRQSIDEAVLRLLEKIEGPEREKALRILEIGLHHEQQHQELILTDLKHLFSLNALAPAYRDPPSNGDAAAAELGWVALPAGVRSIGHRGEGFAFDNETPQHRVFLEPYALADRLITNSEFLEFMGDGGYRRPELWLDLGWTTLQREGWEQPFYWRRRDGGWCEFTLGGERELVPHEPVSHVSYLEADAFARWAGARLPSEEEWEVACRGMVVDGNFVETGRLHPARAPGGERLVQQAFGDLWEWTQSSYAPYPGYRPAEGALGEYNGKFMCNQLVLRGGSCATAQAHLRPTYRNFFYAPDRWQFSGIRLAKEQ
jgi:ergothioneine biosynthesis protein EgtB